MFSRAVFGRRLTIVVTSASSAQQGRLSHGGRIVLSTQLDQDNEAAVASLALGCEPISVAEHEVIDEELRAPSEEIP